MVATLAREVSDLREIVLSQHNDLQARYKTLEAATQQLRDDHEELRRECSSQSLARNASIARLQKDIDRQHFDNLKTRRGLALLQVSATGNSRGSHSVRELKRQPRSLSAESSCGDPGSARFSVEGVGEFTEDVTVGGTSFVQLNASFNKVSRLVEEVPYGKFATLQQVGLVVDSVNMDLPQDVALSSSGEYAFVAALYSDSIAVVDVSDMATPSVVGSLKHFKLDGARHVVVSDDDSYLFVAARDGDSFAVVSVSDPSNPTLAGSITDSTNMDYPVKAAYAPKSEAVYVTATNSASLTRVSVANPSSPAVTGRLKDSTLLNGAIGVAVSRNEQFVYVSGTDFFVVVNVSDAASPVAVGSMSISAADVMPSEDGQFVYVAGGSALSVIDVNDPTQPVLVGSTGPDYLNLRGANNIELTATGSLLVNGYTGSSLAFVDVTDPTAPKVVTRLFDVEYPQGFAVWPNTSSVFMTSASADALATVVYSELVYRR